MNFYTPWTNASKPVRVGLYLTKCKPSPRRNLVKLVFWNGERWVLSGNPNMNSDHTPGPDGRLTQNRYWCGLAFNPEEVSTLPSTLV